MWFSPLHCCAQLILTELIRQILEPIHQEDVILHLPSHLVSSPKEANVISSHRDNLQSASSNTQSLCRQTY